MNRFDRTEESTEVWITEKQYVLLVCCDHAGVDLSCILVAPGRSRELLCMCMRALEFRTSRRAMHARVHQTASLQLTDELTTQL